MNQLGILCFTSVARTQSFSATAHELRITQQAVSKHIRTLEDELGFPLFLRNYQSVRLTKAGEQMLQYFEQREKLISGIHEHFRAGQENPPLRIAWSQWLGAPEWFRQAIVIFRRDHPDNQLDGSMYGREDTCMLMEAGGIVYENTGYAKLINPHVAEFFPEEDMRVPIPIGIAPNRPNGENIRILAINEELGLVVSSFDVDGLVTPYLVSDETSTCFVPYVMLEGHHRSLLPELFEGKSASVETRATGYTITIVKLSGGNVQVLMQNTSMRPYGSRTTWRPEATDGLKY